MNVLVVDDEPLYRRLVRDYFEQEGWKVHLAENGLEGLEKIDSAKIDAIISDIYMPVMNGVQFRDKIRENPNYMNLPFLFVSGYNDNYTLNAVKLPKIEVFIEKTKPLSELKLWVEYLTTPMELRKGIPPSEKPKINPRVTKRDQTDRRH
jgi:CheY-like chemotaxis protein